MEKLRVTVAGREVLQGIDLHIPRRETHILFGKNGSGKSTLHMSLMGFPLPPPPLFPRINTPFFPKKLLDAIIY